MDQVQAYIREASESDHHPDTHKYSSAFCDVYFNQKESAQDIDFGPGDADLEL